MIRPRLSALAPLLATALLGAAAPAAARWKELAPGLDLGTFRLDGGAELQAVRVDASRWDLGLYCASEHGMKRGLPARGWAERFGLVAVINAGMFGTDYITHVGHLRNGRHVNNANRNVYKSVAAFRPRRDGLPPFAIHDLDVPGASLDSVIARYDCVVQNLRLVKRERENRWTPQERRWSEAALGEDDKGRMLLLFCATPMAMHDFNERVLAVEDLRLVAAQHLEGGPQAQLHVDAGGEVRTWVGGPAETWGDADGTGIAWPVPNVIGIRPRPR